MVKLPDYQDPTLDAVDRALEETQSRRDSNGVAMSGIARECDRQIWFDFRWISAIRHTAVTLRKFADGNQGEDVMARRLRLVDGITLVTIDPGTGRQYRLEDFGGHFSGYMDGAALGLIQAPKTWHVWEHKQVENAKFNKLGKLKGELGEKNALRAWDPNYYGQAILYMHYTGLDRHYLTCSTPGGRQDIAVRTEADEAEALRLVARAKRIVFSDRPPARISDDPSFYLCRFCSHADVCHGGQLARPTCRSCLHATPEEDGSWSCARWGLKMVYEEQQQGCQAHLFIPDLIHGEQIDAGQDWVSYRLANGEVWIDGVAGQGKSKVGDRIERDEPCKDCGSVWFDVEAGKGPHAAHLRCAGCGRGGLWLSKREVA